MDAVSTSNLESIARGLTKDQNQQINSTEVAEWVNRAKVIASEQLPGFKLPFDVPDLREFILLWPAVVS